jgi:hypothetical protein
LRIRRSFRRIVRLIEPMVVQQSVVNGRASIVVYPTTVIAWRQPILSSIVQSLAVLSLTRSSGHSAPFCPVSTFTRVTAYMTA